LSMTQGLGKNTIYGQALVVVIIGKACRRKRAQGCAATWKDSRQGLNHEGKMPFSSVKSGNATKKMGLIIQRGQSHGLGHDENVSPIKCSGRIAG